MLASGQFVDFQGADVTEDRRNITDLSLDNRTARVLEAGMKTATGPAAMQAHATATSTFKGLSYAIWIVPVLVFLVFSQGGKSVPAGLVIAALSCIPVAFFSFVWGRVARGNEEFRKNLQDSGVIR